MIVLSGSVLTGFPVFPCLLKELLGLSHSRGEVQNFEMAYMVSTVLPLAISINYFGLKFFKYVLDGGLPTFF